MQKYVNIIYNHCRDFPGGPVVKTSPSNAGGAVSIPGPGAKIPHGSGPKNQNIKQKQYCNKFNEDFKNGPHQKIFKKKIFFFKSVNPGAAGGVGCSTDTPLLS